MTSAFRSIVIFALVACGESRPRTSILLPEPAAQEAPLPIREDCVLAEEKCTRCHTIGRVLMAQAHTRAEWEPFVRRMRLMASSGITEHDADAVLRCLEFRGEQGAR
ncbi:MAG: hypothetical protein ACM31C_33985 [Acidobacteriota bacterium]